MLRNFRRILLDNILVLLFAAAAIVLHAIMPSPGATMDTSVFDSILVKKFGFPAVATGYFVILFLHILIVIRVFAVKSDIGKGKTGCCFSDCFECELTEQKGGEHWFHTEPELDFFRLWIRDRL